MLPDSNKMMMMMMMMMKYRAVATLRHEEAIVI